MKYDWAKIELDSLLCSSLIIYIRISLCSFFLPQLIFRIQCFILYPLQNLVCSSVPPSGFSVFFCSPLSGFRVFFCPPSPNQGFVCLFICSLVPHLSGFDDVKSCEPPTRQNLKRPVGPLNSSCHNSALVHQLMLAL